MAIHKNLTGPKAVHVAALLDDTAGSGEGAHKFVLDTTTTPPTLKKRNAANTGHEAIQVQGNATSAQLAAIEQASIDADALLDARLDALETNGAPPETHAATHGVAGSDPIAIAQSQVTGLTTALAAKAPLSMPITTQAGTAYTLALADAGSLIQCDNAAAITVTVPPNSAVAFPVGTKVALAQAGAGQVTIAAGSGVTIKASGSGAWKTAEADAVVELLKVGADTWRFYGDREAAA